MPTVALGLQISEAGAVLLITDSFEPSRYPPEVEILSLGQPVPNVAITHATRSREEEGEKVFLTVAGFSSAA